MSQFPNLPPYPNGSDYGSSRDMQRAAGSEGEHSQSDERLDQIRDLIFGDLRKSWEARLQTLEMRLQTLEDKLDALRHEVKADRDEHVAVLAQGIDDLSRHIRQLATP